MLVLGAGASRSAGIPLAGEMEKMLVQFAAWAEVKVPSKPKSATSLSWYFERILPALPWDDEDADVKYRYEFIRNCIGRARAEANLTHLLAAHLAVSGLFGPIITTNFDDQALAGFWGLPIKDSHSEPHMVYDPRLPGSTRVIPEVPIIIKAHGHHTIWGTGVLDREIKELTSHVEELLDHVAYLRNGPPSGFLVVGYSGCWKDGVLAFLKRKWSVPIYWCYCGTKPTNENIEQIARRNDLRFVKIKNSDALFISLWREIHSEPELYKPTLLAEYQLFNTQRSFPRRSPVGCDWWGLIKLGSDEESCRNHPKLIELRQKLCPILTELAAQDDEMMLYECMPEVLRPHVPTEKQHLLWSKLPSKEKLEEALPVNFEWTRRNRKLFEMALGRDLECTLPFAILAGAAAWGLE